MTHLIDKATVVAEIEKLISNGKLKCQQSQENNDQVSYIAWSEHIATCGKILSFLDTLEVKDPYERCVQYQSVEDGVKAHAETYSFNIDSELFPQLTKEQQKLWRKEIEEACVNAGDAGYLLAKDIRYKENVEVKEVDLMIHKIIAECCDWLAMNTNLSQNEIEGCRNLMLTVKEEQCKVQKGEEV